MAEGQFDKDFGYLMPFLDKVASAADNLSDAAAREELKRLIADEKPRWSRIQKLLSGASGQSPSAVKTVEAGQAKTNPAASRAEASATEKEPLSFTVGSLRPRPR